MRDRKIVVSLVTVTNETINISFDPKNITIGDILKLNTVYKEVNIIEYQII